MPDIIRAILLMVISMFFFTLADLFVKLSSRTLPSEVVITVVGGGTMVLFYAAMRLQNLRLFHKDYWHYAVAVRTSGEVIAGVGIILALAVVPLATVTAIMQSQPLLITAAGALFLGERVGIRRFSAVIIGLVGVLFIIRPGLSDFSIHSLIVMIAVIGMTMRDVGSRMVPSTIPTLVIALYGAASMTIVGIGMMIAANAFVMPTGITWLYVVIMILAGSAGVYFITNAMRLGEVSVVSPFRYVKIVFGMGAGVLFLGERIDGFTMIGTLIVTGAGIYAFMRERHLLKQAIDIDHTTS